MEIHEQAVHNFVNQALQVMFKASFMLRLPAVKSTIGIHYFALLPLVIQSSNGQVLHHVTNFNKRWRAFIFVHPELPYQFARCEHAILEDF